MVASSARDQAKISKKYSQHPVRRGLLGFAGQNMAYNNPYQIFGYDSLHIDNLGIWKNIMEHAKDFADKAMKPESRGIQFVRALSDNLRAVPK